METSKIIQMIAKDNKYLQTIKNITRNDDLYMDLYNEMILIIDKTDNMKLNKLVNDNQLQFFWTRVAMNQWRSKTSKFYYNYKKSFDDLDYDYDWNLEDNTETYIDTTDHSTNDFYQYMIERIKKELFWYDAELFQLYLKLGSLNKVYKKTKIPYVHVRDSHLRVKTWIEENLKEEWKDAIKGDFTFNNKGE